MRCPVCEIENPYSQIRCSSCGGRLSPTGIDYSALSNEVDWQDCGRCSEEDEAERRRAAGKYPFMLLKLLLYLTATGFMSSCMLYTGRSEGDDGKLLLGFALLAVFSLLLYRLWREIKAVYSEPDTGVEPMSVQDMDKTLFDITGLPPRR